MEKEHNDYIGDVVNGLAKEAAFWRHKCSVLEAQIRQMQQANPEPPEAEYIYQEHTNG
jgi:hypothetical protein